LPNIEFAIFEVDNVIIDSARAVEKAQWALGEELRQFIDGTGKYPLAGDVK